MLPSYFPLPFRAWLWLLDLAGSLGRAVREGWGR